MRLLALLMALVASNAHALPAPRILTNWIVNAAGAPLPPAPVAPGSIISIHGLNFISPSGDNAGDVSATVLPLPTNINGTQVLINSRFAPLSYVDSNQINAQVPWEVSGAAYLTVQVIVNGLPSNLATVALVPSAPGILTVTHAQDGSQVTSSDPAMPGENVTIYAFGLGAVANPPATGAAASAELASSTLLTPVLTVGGVSTDVISSALTVDQPGLYELNARIPPETPNGDDITVVLNVGGAISNTITISVQSATPSGVDVSVSPVSVSLLAAATQQFTATVTGADDSSVTWTVNGIPAGSADVGTISETGLYTAPATLPASGMAFIAATSAADSTVAGTATASVSLPPMPASPVGRFRSKAPGLYGLIERRGWPSEYTIGQPLQNFVQFDSVVGSTVATEVGLQLDRMRQMGITAVTFEWRTADSGVGPEPFVPPSCLLNSALGPQWPQPTATEIANMKPLFDLVQSKGMRVRLRLVNTHMEEQPPTNSQIWLGSILRAIGGHPALDMIAFDGTPHLVLSSPNGVPDKCGIPAEAELWYGPADVAAKYIEWAIGYAQSFGVPARKLSAEAIVGNYFTDSVQPNCCSTDGHFWNPVTTLKAILDAAGIPDEQRTYALSFYEHRKCSTFGSLPCTDLDPHGWAEQTIQTMYGIIGSGNGARVVAPELGIDPPTPTWRTEWALESLILLLEKYQIEGGSFWRWANDSTSQDSDPTLADPIKRRGVAFVYNPVQKEVLDWGGFHLTAIPNGSFEDDVDPNGVPTHWTAAGNGSASAYYLPQENAQPQVPSRGSYCLRLTANDNTASISVTSDPIAVTPSTSYTTTANLRFAWSGDPNPAANANSRPRVFVTVHYLNAAGQPASVPSTNFSYFQENSTQGFQTFVFQYTTPGDAKSVQIEIGAARNGLSTPIVFDADNLR